MFDKFSVEYLTNGKWYPIDKRNAEIDDNPMYNRLTFTPVKAEGVRFINSTATDLQRHIYKIRVNEKLKESYNFRTVRDNEKLYIFVDGRELDMLDISLPASKVGFCNSNYYSTYQGILYYHIGEKQQIIKTSSEK